MLHTRLVNPDTVAALFVGIALTMFLSSLPLPKILGVNAAKRTSQAYVRANSDPIPDYCKVETSRITCVYPEPIFHHPPQRPFEQMGFVERWDRITHALNYGLPCQIVPMMPNGLICVDGTLREPDTLEPWKVNQ